MKSYGYQSLTRIRLIDIIVRSLSTNPNAYSVGTCNDHGLLLRHVIYWIVYNYYMSCVVIRVTQRELRN